MDVVMTPEERAEMEAASGSGAVPEETPTGVPVTSLPTDIPSETQTTTPTEHSSATSPASAPAEPGIPQTSLAHHSSFSSGQSTPPAAGSSTNLTAGSKEKEKEKKGKAKLTPEQKAKLEEIELVKEKEKKARYVVFSIDLIILTKKAWRQTLIRLLESMR